MVTTLVGLGIALSFGKRCIPRVDQAIESSPLILLEDGKRYFDRLLKARVDESDILAAARELQRLERIDQIKYTVLERSGGISIIPKGGG